MSRTTVHLPLGDHRVAVTVPNLLASVSPQPCPAVPDDALAVRNALAHPIGTPPLADLAKGHDNAVIVVNDYTRPYPGALMVREIAAVLNAAGIPDEQITLLVACGVHKAQPEDTLRRQYGDDVVNRFRMVNHVASTPENLTSLGFTDGGVEVCVNRLYAEASLRITTGLIAPHPAAGFSGGRKSILPGIAGLETLKKHHSMPIRPYAPAMGWTTGNPFHEEAVKAARIARVDFIVNTVSNADKQLVAVVAGDLEAAWQEGVRISTAIWTVSLPAKADVVLVSPGGYPRDIDLQQSQKALSCAELLCKPGGTLILAAECRNGLGNQYAQYLKAAATPQEVIDTFIRDGFNQNSNAKAFHFARAAKDYTVAIAGMNDLNVAELEDMFLKGFATVQEAVDDAVTRHGEAATFLVCPVAYGLIVNENG